MKIENYQVPKSAFLSVDKDLNLIVSRMLKNTRLQKLLYYPTSNCMEQPKLNQKQISELFDTQGHIRIVPSIEINPEIKNFVVISFDTFAPNESNPEFRNNTIVFTILCHKDCWHIKDFELRPFKIAGEIDSMLHKKHLTGIGDLLFGGGTFVKVDEEYSGLSICYVAIHGGEDNFKMPNPIDEEQFVQEFDEMYNKD